MSSAVGADRRVCPYIWRQFLTLLLLSYILFVVFLYVLFGRKKNEKRPAHGLSKSLPFFARATSCEHSVKRRLSLVSAVPISGTKELASRTPGIVWHTRSDTFVLVPQLELTRAVAQTVPDLFWHYYCSRFSVSIGNSLNDGTVKNIVKARFCSGVSEDMFKVR